MAQFSNPVNALVRQYGPQVNALLQDVGARFAQGPYNLRNNGDAEIERRRRAQAIAQVMNDEQRRAEIARLQAKYGQ